MIDVWSSWQRGQNRSDGSALRYTASKQFMKGVNCRLIKRRLQFNEGRGSKGTSRNPGTQLKPQGKLWIENVEAYDRVHFSIQE